MCSLEPDLELALSLQGLEVLLEWGLEDLRSEEFSVFLGEFVDPHGLGKLARLVTKADLGSSASHRSTSAAYSNQMQRKDATPLPSARSPLYF